MPEPPAAKEDATFPPSAAAASTGGLGLTPEEINLIKARREARAYSPIKKAQQGPAATPTADASFRGFDLTPGEINLIKARADLLALSLFADGPQHFHQTMEKLEKLNLSKTRPFESTLPTLDFQEQNVDDQYPELFGFKLGHGDYHLFFLNLEKNVHQTIKPSSFDWCSKLHSDYFLYFDFYQDKDLDKYFDLAKKLLPCQNDDTLLLDNFNTDDWIHYVLAFPFTDPLLHDFIPLPDGPKLPFQVPDVARHAPDVINSGYPICIPEVRQHFPILIWFACHMETLIKDNYHNYTHSWYIDTLKKITTFPRWTQRTSALAIPRWSSRPRRRTTTSFMTQTTSKDWAPSVYISQMQPTGHLQLHISTDLMPTPNCKSQMFLWLHCGTTLLLLSMLLVQGIWVGIVLGIRATSAIQWKPFCTYFLKKETVSFFGKLSGLIVCISMPFWMLLV